MSTEFFVIAAIITAFVAFAVTSAWADLQTRGGRDGVEAAAGDTALPGVRDLDAGQQVEREQPRVRHLFLSQVRDRHHQRPLVRASPSAIDNAVCPGRAGARA
jgi:hypothetical protein